MPEPCEVYLDLHKNSATISQVHQTYTKFYVSAAVSLFHWGAHKCRYLLYMSFPALQVHWQVSPGHKAWPDRSHLVSRQGRFFLLFCIGTGWILWLHVFAVTGRPSLSVLDHFFMVAKLTPPCGSWHCQPAGYQSSCYLSVRNPIERLGVSEQRSWSRRCLIYWFFPLHFSLQLIL